MVDAGQQRQDGTEGHGEPALAQSGHLAHLAPPVLRGSLLADGAHPVELHDRQRRRPVRHGPDVLRAHPPDGTLPELHPALRQPHGAAGGRAVDADGREVGGVAADQRIEARAAAGLGEHALGRRRRQAVATPVGSGRPAADGLLVAGRPLLLRGRRTGRHRLVLQDAQKPHRLHPLDARPEAERGVAAHPTAEREGRLHPHGTEPARPARTEHVDALRPLHDEQQPAEAAEGRPGELRTVRHDRQPGLRLLGRELLPPHREHSGLPRRQVVQQRD